MANTGIGATDSGVGYNIVQAAGLPQNTLAQTNVGATINGFQQAASNSSIVPAAPPALGSVTPGQGASDTRIRLQPLNVNLYGTGNANIIGILQQTNGIIFPYTPTITFTQGVDYMTVQLVHSDTDYAAYSRTPSVKLSVSGKFTVQNQQEGLYALAVIHFLRAMSKSYFGKVDAASGNAGLPPPVLMLSGYGSYMFGNSGSGVRVILTNHSWSFDDSVDYIPISIGGSGGTSAGGGTAKLPALFTISLDLTVVQTPTRMMATFNFNDFASGALMQGNNSGWI